MSQKKTKDFAATALKQVQRNAEVAHTQRDRFAAAAALAGGLPEAKAGAPSAVLLERIADRPSSIRKVNPAEAMKRALSIAELGLLQNLVVDRVPLSRVLAISSPSPQRALNAGQVRKLAAPKLCDRQAYLPNKNIAS